MTDTILLGKQEFRDQKERMVEQGVSEEEAEEAFKNVKTQVTLAAQELDKEWSDETINAVTNLVVAIQQQQHQNRLRNRKDFYDRLFRFLTGTVQMAAFGAGVFLAVAGQPLLGGVLIILAVSALIRQLRS